VGGGIKTKRKSLKFKLNIYTPFTWGLIPGVLKNKGRVRKEKGSDISAPTIHISPLTLKFVLLKDQMPLIFYFFSHGLTHFAYHYCSIFPLNILLFPTHCSYHFTFYHFSSLMSFSELGKPQSIAGLLSQLTPVVV
jgi:hypothetical protein